MIPRRLVLSSLILSTAMLYAQKPGEPSPEPEPEKPTGPVVLRLVAKKTTYVLDRGGMTAEAYKKAILDGTVTPPAVDLALELVNVSKITQRVRIRGAAPKLKLDLQGKGVMTSREARQREPLTVQSLEPGEKHVIPLRSLAGFESMMATPLFWTEPGKYTLTASFATYLYDQPVAQPAPGAKGKGNPKRGGVNPNPNPIPAGRVAARATPVTLTSKSIELTITEKK